MRRLGLAIILGLLAFSVSGVSGLIASEPCSLFETSGGDDGACPPTCVTCGCCAQGIEPVQLPLAVSPCASVGELQIVLPEFPSADPRDILHVPKPVRA